YLVDSGGAGRQRGGLGQVIEIENGEGKPFAINAAYDRTVYGPRGRDGGAEGRRGLLRLDDGTVLRSKGNQTIPAGRRLILEMPGGGGHGDPAGRDPAKIRDDLRDGFISAEAARADYGYEGEG
ncbi:MAG: hydantoinase B/oxoprolinase family protein, partial [Rhizobiales bacterium]|nr:hydantoinase B/oxoprolinase family protein [Hyphomicrobiales bacterium]